MQAKIEVKLRNRCILQWLSAKQLTNQQQMEALKLWKAYSFDALHAMIANKPTIAYIYSCDEELNLSEVNGIVSKQTESTGTYYMVRSNAWSTSDVCTLASLMEYEQAAVWFQIMPVPIEQAHYNPVTFFTIANKIATGAQVEVSNIECIGAIDDGSELVWVNPTWASAEKTLPQLEELANMLDFVWCLINEKDN